MKTLKMLSLAALAALMAMAVLGASSASAEGTRLCSAESCSSEITHVHEVSIGHALLLSSFATVECSALFLGDVEEEGAPLIIEGTFSYTCLSGCTATEENGPAEIKVLKEGTELAVVTGEGLVHVVCGLNCRYNGVGLEGHGLGALTAENETGEVSIEGATVNKESGFLCPSTSALDIVTEPLSATYLGGGALALSEILLNVGATETIVVENTSSETITIEKEVWDPLYLEGLGSSCLGNLGPGSSCQNRKLKCLKKGTTTYKVYTSIGWYSIDFKCD